MVLYNDKSTKLRKYLLLILIPVCLICIGVALISVLSASGEEGFGDTSINEYYNLGQDIEIPDATLTVGGENYTVSPKVTYPNGAVYAMNSHSINQLGKYSVLYETEVGGKVYSENKSFQVYEYLFSNSVTGEGFVYGVDLQENLEDISGLRFDLCQGESLLYNKIIDLNSYEMDDSLIRFDAIPDNATIRDCTTVYVVLTDVYNPNNSIKIRIVRAPDAADPNGITNEIGYISVIHGTHPFQYKRSDKYYYGESFRNSFCGRKVNSAPIEIRFDYATKTLYSYWDNGKGKPELNKLRDLVLDFPNDPWEGFTTGECKLSIYAEGYVSSDLTKPFRGMLMEIDGKDLTTEEAGTFTTHKVLSTKGAEIKFNEYESDKGVPNAVVGYSYKIFDTEFRSIYGGEKLYTNVYYAYTSSSRYEVPTDNGYFIPDRVGVYTIVYTVVDVFGNVAKTELDVTAVADNGYGLYLEVPNYQSYQVGNVGEHFELVGVENVIVKGNNGTAEIKILAVDGDGNMLDVTANDFLPLKGGNWKIIYTAKDYSGRIGMFEYPLTVNVFEKVIFDQVKDMPKYFIVNANNPIPSLEYIDYNVNADKKQVVSVSVEKGGVKVADVTDGFFKPTEAGIYDVVYEATSALNVPDRKSLSVLAIDLGYGGNIATWDRTKYFYSSSGDIVSTNYDANGVHLTFKENGKADFIRPVNAMDFNMTLKISETEKAASSVSILLTDVNNSAQQVKISLVNNMGALQLVINDRKEYNVSGQTYSNMKTAITFASGIVSCGATKATVNEYLNGEKYQGFESLIADLAIETAVDQGVVGNTTVLVDSINGQSFAKPVRKFDGVVPSIVYSETLLNKLDVGGTVKIPFAKVIDVMSPKTTASITILDPNGNVVRDVDGKELNSVAIDKDYYITLSVAGNYSLVYNYADDNGNSNSASLVIDAVSRNKPVITITDKTETVKVGESFRVGTATCTGEFTEYNLYIFVLGPTGNLKPVNMVETEADYMMFKAKEAGVYKVLYMVIDQWGNQALSEYFVTAE